MTRTTLMMKKTSSEMKERLVFLFLFCFCWLNQLVLVLFYLLSISWYLCWDPGDLLATLLVSNSVFACHLFALMFFRGKVFLPLFSSFWYLWF